MATRIVSVPAGTSLVVPAPARTCIVAQPGTGGTAQIAVGPGGAGGSFTPAPQGANTAPYSLATDTYASIMGNVGQAQLTATTATGVFLLCDLSQYPSSFPERQMVAQSGVAFTTIASSTAELEMFSLRFPAGYFQTNCQIEWEAAITLTNSATVKTIKAYFGASTNSATAAALEGGTNIWSNVYTSMIGARFGGLITSRADNATLITSNPGLISAGGWGSSTTANVTVTSAYSGPAAVEQVFILTATKATGTDTVTLDQINVKVYQ